MVVVVVVVGGVEVEVGWQGHVPHSSIPELECLAFTKGGPAVQHGSRSR